MEPTSLQRLGGWFIAQFFHMLCVPLQARFVLNHQHPFHKLTCWAWGNSVFWSERAAGRI